MMTTYVLLFWIIGGSSYSGRNPAAASAEFATLVACETAAAKVKAETNIPHMNLFFGYTCSPKGNGK